MRKTARNDSLSKESLDALIDLLSFMAELFYPKIRDLLSSKEPDHINQKRWESYNNRLHELMLERLNIKRSIVKKFLSDNQSDFSRELILTLALSSGKCGKNRLKASLLDPII